MTTAPKYPVLEAVISDPATGRKWLLGPCCFQDMLNPEFNDFELAGMGVAIIGNVCQGIQSGVLKMHYDAVLQIRHGHGSDPVVIPWPGMLDDAPMKLDLAQMPFDPIIFIDKDQSRYRIDRLKLMDRIMATWLPTLKSKLAFGGVAV